MIGRSPKASPNTKVSTIPSSNCFAIAPLLSYCKNVSKRSRLPSRRAVVSLSTRRMRSAHWSESLSIVNVKRLRSLKQEPHVKSQDSSHYSHRLRCVRRPLVTPWQDGTEQIYGRWKAVKNQSVDDQTEAAGAGSMNAKSKNNILRGDGSRLATAEQRLRQLGIKLPAPPEPFGI